ncbi:DUF222 domain-containing protein [Actinopolymorpha rutila]|uniref:DUF222 domain-containing protein n=1 Tax=Actinopolymorpha rutila TaxID=446787 RepID=A0A852ZCE4_9ACTN|nr:DUF222 domain-containing protein [Actinopolymorpha rutila]NYH90781.1 hypothetical protein [Actinopolymorpha rutila]
MSDGGECFGDHLGEQPGGRRVLPAGFADLPGGPELAAAVASVDVRECNGWELEELIKAQRRLICWLDAECLAAVNELTYAEPGMRDEPAGRTVTPDPMTPEVLEPLLGWTGYRAHQYVSLAGTLPRLPRVREALATGGLELNEVRTIVDRITDAKPDLWGGIEDAIFPKVLDVRGGLLRAKVEAEVLKADPDAALKRHRAARTGRNVAMWPAVDGVADLAIRGLSADQAAEAYGYIDAIARAVKSTGDSRTLSQLRADVAAALLTGTAHITDCSVSTATANHNEQELTEQDDQDESERAEGESEREPDEQARGETEQGQDHGEQGPCAVHRYPDHDLHSADCDCSDCAPAGTGNTTPHYTPCHCSTAHDTAAHDAAAHAATPNKGHPAAGQIPQQNRRPDEPTDPPPDEPTDPPPDEVTDPPPGGTTRPQPSPPCLPRSRAGAGYERGRRSS